MPSLHQIWGYVYHVFCLAPASSVPALVQAGFFVSDPLVTISSEHLDVYSRVWGCDYCWCCFHTSANHSGTHFTYISTLDFIGWGNWCMSPVWITLSCRLLCGWLFLLAMLFVCCLHDLLCNSYVFISTWWGGGPGAGGGRGTETYQQVLQQYWGVHQQLGCLQV